MDCLFCKITKGEIPADKVYEDDKVLAFLDINPVNKGHTLVVPKEHYENLIETPDELVGELMMVVKKIAKALGGAVGAEGINIAVNNGQVAGQVIFHTHIHLIPRFGNDGYRLWAGKEYKSDEEKKEVAEKIRKELI